MISFIKNWINLRKFFKNPITVHALHVAQEGLWDEKYPILISMNKNYKEDFIHNILKICAEIIDSSNRIIKTREHLSNAVLALAGVQVLIETEEKLSHPAVSYQLHKYIDEIKNKNEDIKKILQEAKNLFSKKDLDDYSDIDILKAFLHIRQNTFKLLTNSINIIRVVLDDYDRDNDWLNPFLLSMMIWREDTYRREIGLESLIEKEEGCIAGLKHSTFLHIVMSVEKYPNIAFNNIYKF